jgi:hypothetical protein
MSGQTPQEYAQELNARLHAMTDERWKAYVRYMESKEELAEAQRGLMEEAKGLAAGLRADKWARPENKGRRMWLGRALHDLRATRLADLQERHATLKSGGK